tara:strand:- start:11479 stop:12213 length:735 start_codon:yes stop_codon:yes gene_type:complete
MNIQKLISKIKIARKRRLINSFHLSPKSGIDVGNEEYQSILQLLKDMFKCFKANKCSIDVSFYGEIFITLAECDHSFELSITNRPRCIDIKSADTHLGDNHFIKMNSSSFNNSLTVSVKTMRKKSEWKHYSISEFDIDGLILAELIIKNMHQRVMYYSNSDEALSLDQQTKLDRLAAIHLGGAILGKSSMLHHLSSSLRKIIYISKITISAKSIIIGDSLDRESIYHYFGDREANFFSQYLINY